MPTRNLRDGQLLIQDAGANSVTVGLDRGELAWAETNPVVNVTDRGTLSHMRPGPQVPVAGRFTARFQEFVTAGPGDASPYEALTRTGRAAGWASTNTDNGDVYAVTLAFTIANPQAGGSDETITFALACPTRIGFAQADPYDTLAVEFQDFQTAPAIAKT